MVKLSRFTINQLKARLKRRRKPMTDIEAKAFIFDVLNSKIKRKRLQGRSK